MSIFHFYGQNQFNIFRLECRLHTGKVPTQNFLQLLTVTIDILMSHDAKVNQTMWAWQLCDVASVNK